MIQTVKCKRPECLNHFVPYKGHQLFCSERCKLKYYSERRALLAHNPFRKHKCHCGKRATARFRGKYVCKACFYDARKESRRAK